MTADVYRDGNVLIVGNGAVLPDTCVKCNRPAAKMTTTFYWHSPVLYLVVLLNILVYAVIAMIVRKRATVEYGLCDEHRAERRQNITLAWMVAIAGFVLPVVGLIAVDAGPGLAALAPWLFALSPLLILGGAIWGIAKAAVLRPEKIDASAARLKGAGEDFLIHLPQAPSVPPATGAARIG